MIRARPQHLPDFEKPPLNEVVLGVQFSPPVGYQQVRAGEIWALYRDRYPTVQEQPALFPTFETFGLPQFGQMGPGLNFVAGPMHDRFWFANQSGDELIQFQRDRLLHNWRKVGDLINEYPRFEVMVDRFSSEVRQLESYVASLAPQLLAINQCEVSYINHFEVGDEPVELSKWFKNADFGGQRFDDVNMVLREIIRGEGAQPIGRIIYEITTAILVGGQRVIQFSLTVRGAPSGTSIDAALNFIGMGRELIVTRFAQLTAQEAHVKWQRRQ